MTQFSLSRATSLLGKKALGWNLFFNAVLEQLSPFFTNGSCNRSAGYRTTWLSPHHLSSASCHLQQPSSHTWNHHHMYCYSTTACLLPLLLLFYSCQRLLRMTKSNRRKKVVGAEGEPCWLAASSMCFCVFKISTWLLKEQHFYILQVILWNRVFKKLPC